MLRYFFAILFGFLIFFSGCSQRKDFEPKHISGSIVFNHFLNADLDKTSRVSATLKNGEVFAQSGKTLLRLKKPSSFINETSDYYILAPDCQNIEVINKNNQKSQKFSVPTCVIAANIKDSYLAYVLLDNSYGIINMKTGETKLSDRNSQAIAVDSLIAQPLFLDTTVVFPMLDGQIVVASLNSFKIERVVIVNSEHFFSNVIYLDKKDNNLIAATSKKVIVLSDGKKFEYSANIRDLKFYKNSIYLLTLEGKIMQLDLTLRVVNEVELPYAIFSGIVITHNKLFTLERLGYLIVLDLDSFQYQVYTLRNILGKILDRKILFYDNHRIYYDRYYLDFLKDWQK